jgi:hypothetical protein
MHVYAATSVQIYTIKSVRLAASPSWPRHRFSLYRLIIDRHWRFIAVYAMWALQSAQPCGPPLSSLKQRLKYRICPGTLPPLPTPFRRGVCCPFLFSLSLCCRSLSLFWGAETFRKRVSPPPPPPPSPPAPHLPSLSTGSSLLPLVALMFLALFVGSPLLLRGVNSCLFFLCSNHLIWSICDVFWGCLPGFDASKFWSGQLGPAPFGVASRFCSSFASLLRPHFVVPCPCSVVLLGFTACFILDIPFQSSPLTLFRSFIDFFFFVYRF